VRKQGLYCDSSLVLREFLTVFAHKENIGQSVQAKRKEAFVSRDKMEQNLVKSRGFLSASNNNKVEY